MDIPLRTKAIAARRKVVNDFSKDFSRLFYLKMGLAALLHGVELICRKCGRFQRGWYVTHLKEKLFQLDHTIISAAKFIRRKIVTTSEFGLNEKKTAMD